MSSCQGVGVGSVLGEEEEEGVELVFFEVVWEVFHGVGTENSNVLVRTGSRGIGTVIVVVVVVAYITHPTRNGRAAFGNPHNV